MAKSPNLSSRRDLLFDPTLDESLLSKASPDEPAFRAFHRPLSPAKGRHPPRTGNPAVGANKWPTNLCTFEQPRSAIYSPLRYPARASFLWNSFTAIVLHIHRGLA